MIDFSTLKDLTIPEGNVKEIAIGGVTFWKSSVSLGSLAVGTEVFMNLNGWRSEFIVVHQGLPDATLYDSSCDGTWLLLKSSEDLVASDYSYPSKKWTESSDTSNNIYAQSTTHKSYLNTEVFGMFDSTIQSLIKQVKIPYVDGDGKTGVIKNGADGLSTKLFLLSCSETGLSSDNGILEFGAKLDYFGDKTTAGSESRIMYNYGGTTAGCWWTRTPAKNSNTAATCNSKTGGPASITVTSKNGGYSGSPCIRPALILPSSACIDENFNVIA